MGIVQDEWDRVNKEISDVGRLARLGVLLEVATILDNNLPPKGATYPWGHVEAVKRVFEFIKSEKDRLGHG